MDNDQHILFSEWVMRLSSLTASPYIPQMAAAAAEFENFASTIRRNHNLVEAYSVAEVMQACKEVCSHSGMPNLDVMRLLAGGNIWLVRDFIMELGKITGKLKEHIHNERY